LEGSFQSSQGLNTATPYQLDFMTNA
jgi:hypothetical protein